MLTRYSRLLPVGVLALLPFAGATLWAGVLGRPGQTGVYRLEADLAQRPDFERENRLSIVETRLQLGPVETIDQTRHQWVHLAFSRLNGDAYSAWLLVSEPPPSAVPRVARYLWKEPGWPDPVEPVHETTGAALLPRLSFWEYA